MPIIQTSSLTPDVVLSESDNHQIYCGLDNCVTLEVNEEQSSTWGHNRGRTIYDFERALQAPYLEVMRRGFKVDQMGRYEAAESLKARINHLQGILDEFATSVWGRSLNPRSNSQLKDFFYRAMRLPEQWLSFKGVRKISCNREALENLDVYLYARPIIGCVLGIRDLSKQREVFETEIDSDGRFRSSYNIAGTETGRPSSSENAFGTGGNAQNISPSLRYVFIPDDGYKLAVIDYEQSEARDMGFFCGCLFNDWSFLDACESGDLHTSNARRVWRELPWPSNPADARRFADRIYYRDFSYRDMAKRLGHLTDYMGTAWTAARVLKIPPALAEDFQNRYVLGPEAAFPCIPRYWRWVAEQIQTGDHSITTPFGRKRYFFSHPGNDATIREAIAYNPQSTTSDRTNLGFWRTWRYMPQVQLLAQGYDSITFQYREDFDEEDVICEALEKIRVELSGPNGRSFVVPGEAKIGWNWGNQVTEEDQDKARKEGKRPPRLNPYGLVKYRRGRKDTRERPGNGFKRIMAS